MTTVTGVFTGEATSAILAVKPGQSVSYSTTGTWTGYAYIERQERSGTWPVLAGGTADTNFSGTALNDTKRDQYFRFRIMDTDSENAVTGTLTYEVADQADIVYTLEDADGNLLVDYTDDGAEFPGDVTVLGDLAVAGGASVTGNAAVTGTLAVTSTTTLTGNATLAGGTLRLGTTDAAAPTAQAITLQSVVAGTTDTAGVALTINGSKGTGTGVGGAVIVKVAPAGSTGSDQNALATALTIGGDTSATFVHSVIPSTAVTVSALPATPVLGMICQVSDADTPALGSTVVGGAAAAALVWYNGTNWTVIGV